MKYFIAENGKSVGPLEPRELLDHGLTVNTLVWCETMTAWQPAGTVPELQALLNGQTPDGDPLPPPFQPQQQPQQPYQQQAYGQPQQSYYGNTAPVSGVDDYKIVSLLLLIASVMCCCCINPIAPVLAIVTYVYSSKTSNALRYGAIADAASYSSTTKILAIITAVVLAAGWLLNVGMMRNVNIEQCDEVLELLRRYQY